MMDRLSIVIVLAIAGVGLFIFQQQQEAAPVPAPAPLHSGPDLLTPFRAGNHPQAAEHARAFGEICGALAIVLERDWQQPKPRITTGVQIDDLRRITRELRMDHWSFQSLYPQLGPTIESYMNNQVGIKGGTLSSEMKQRWIEAFRSLEFSSLYAADQL